MGIFDNVRRVLGAKTSTSGDIAAAIAEASKAEVDATAEHQTLESRRREMLLASDLERTEYKRRLADAEERARDAAEYRAELEQKHAGVLAGEQESVRRAQYDEAAAAVDAARKEVKKRYPKLYEDLTSLQSVIADANRKREIVNNRLPEGVAPLEDVEAFRDIPAVSRNVVKEEIVQRWCYMDGSFLGKTAVRKMQTDKEGQPFVRDDLGRQIPVVQLDLRQEEVQPAEPRISAGRIANASLPPFSIDADKMRRLLGLKPERETETKITRMLSPREEEPYRRKSTAANGASGRDSAPVALAAHTAINKAGG